MNTVELKASEDGATLTFAVTSRSSEETSFDVLVKTPWFSGKAPASTYFSGSPAMLFREMASEWKGWEKPKTWADLEDRVRLSATSDSTGHIRVAVELRGADYESGLKATLVYEAGQLERMASDVASLLPETATNAP